MKQELENLREKSNELEVHWKNEKEIIVSMRDHKKEIDRLKQEADIEERRGNLQKVAEVDVCRALAALHPPHRSRNDTRSSPVRSLAEKQRLLPR